MRQGRKGMGFAGHTSTHDMQILSAGEVYDRLDAAYVVGLEARGLSSCSRRYVQSGKVKVTEWTNYALAVRMKAAATGVPYLPARNMMGTDEKSVKKGDRPLFSLENAFLLRPAPASLLKTETFNC